MMHVPSSPVFRRLACLLESRPIAELIEMIEAVTAAGGCFRLYPRGRSMLPILREGIDSVTLTAPKDLGRGDILLVRVDGGYVLHRAILVTDTAVTVCGDALTVPEGPVPKSAVIAKANAVFRGADATRPTSTGRPLYLARIRCRRFLRRLLARLKK